MSRDLKKRGFTFVGSTICYAFMQATGMVNDHLVGCFRYKADHNHDRARRHEDTRSAIERSRRAVVMRLRVSTPSCRRVIVAS